MIFFLNRKYQKYCWKRQLPTMPWGVWGSAGKTLILELWSCKTDPLQVFSNMHFYFLELKVNSDSSSTSGMSFWRLSWTRGIYSFQDIYFSLCDKTLYFLLQHKFYLQKFMTSYIWNVVFMLQVLLSLFAIKVNIDLFLFVALFFGMLK